MTKRQQQMVNAWRRSEVETIWQAYKNPSYAKEKAFNYCMNKCKEMNGYRPRITGSSCFVFSFAFVYWLDGKEYMHYETAQNTYDFCMEV